MSSHRLSSKEKLELERRVVLHLAQLDAAVEWTPVVKRFVERWNTRKEAPEFIQVPIASVKPLHFRALISTLKLQALLDFQCPQCGALTNDGLVRTASGALRCTSCTK